MPAATKNFVIEQKATFRRRLVYRDKRTKPINLTGFRARMQIRNAADGELVKDLSTENGGITLGGSAGTIDLVISAADTTTMSFEAALYDLKLIAPNGDETRLLQGKFTLSPGQTV